jgi:hypothetical protein
MGDDRWDEGGTDGALGFYLIEPREFVIKKFLPK